MTTTKPLFSIITITLDHLSGLRQTHQSLLNQTYTNYEWIVIDGLSNDSTDDYLKTTDAQWISEQDNGIYDAMNKGVNRAQGYYLIFMNAGDCFADSHILGDLEKVIKKENPDFIYGDSLELFKGKHIIKKARSHTKINQGMFTHHQSMIYKKLLIEGIKYNQDYLIAADYDLTLNALSNTQKISYLPKPICVFECNGISQVQAFRGRKEQFIIRQKNGLPFIQNIMTFITQTAAYSLRKTAPALYWSLKR